MQQNLQAQDSEGLLETKICISLPAAYSYHGRIAGHEKLRGMVALLLGWAVRAHPVVGLHLPILPLTPQHHAEEEGFPGAEVALSHPLLVRFFPAQKWSARKFNTIFIALSKLWTDTIYTDKKENQILLIYKEIQKGSVAKSNTTNGLLIYDKIFAHFLIY